VADPDECAAALRHFPQVAPAQAEVVQARLDALEDEVAHLSQANPQARMVRDLYTLMGRVVVHLTTPAKAGEGAITIKAILLSPAGQKLLGALATMALAAAAAAFGGGLMTGGG